MVNDFKMTFCEVFKGFSFLVFLIVAYYVNYITPSLSQSLATQTTKAGDHHCLLHVPHSIFYLVEVAIEHTLEFLHQDQTFCNLFVCVAFFPLPFGQLSEIYLPIFLVSFQF